MIESDHEYKPDLQIFETVRIPGARQLEVIFDDKCSTEARYDFVTLYKDNSNQAFWGEESYSGSVDGGGRNFPPSSSPIIVDSDSFVFHFHSDGSSRYFIFVPACTLLSLLFSLTRLLLVGGATAFWSEKPL